MIIKQNPGAAGTAHGASIFAWRGAVETTLLARISQYLRRQAERLTRSRRRGWA